jgi:hypothetical protein
MPVEVKRTLVKSRPELWAEVSDPGALARHLGPIQSIRITRSEPESLVAWEAERVSGEVRLEASGFGTRVTLSAEERALPPAPEPAPRPTFWDRLRRRSPAERPSPAAIPLGEGRLPELEPTLAAAMDALGAAHHRPFSRV